MPREPNTVGGPPDGMRSASGDLTLRVGLVISEGFDLSCFTPLFVFEAANNVLHERRYEVSVLAADGGRVAGASGLEVIARRFDDVVNDTIIVSGGPRIDRVDPTVISFLQAASCTARRVASIGLGAFALGEAGLLDGRRATTHWAFVEDLRGRFPLAIVESDRLFVQDGLIWTSAGMTSGVDLALGLIERDVGRDRARAVAQHLVVNELRSGARTQGSVALDLDVRTDRVAKALEHARRNLRKRLSVEDLAEAANLSPRQFTRVFSAETGCSPARAIERLRLEAAQLLIRQGRLSMATIANETGFGDGERMRRAFHRSFARSPRALRDLEPVRVTL